jgi:hypothetical protein
MDRRLFLLAALALAGCASLPAPKVMAPAGAGFAELEPIYLAHAGREALTIRVGSNGCTAKGDFAFYVQRQGGAVQLAFGRKRFDACKAPGHVDLTFTWAELGLTPATRIFLLNPITAGAEP